MAYLSLSSILMGDTLSLELQSVGWIGDVLWPLMCLTLQRDTFYLLLDCDFLYLTFYLSLFDLLLDFDLDFDLYVFSVFVVFIRFLYLEWGSRLPFLLVLLYAYFL